VLAVQVAEEVAEPIQWGLITALVILAVAVEVLVMVILEQLNKLVLVALAL
jgi:hypothetical protein